MAIGTGYKETARVKREERERLINKEWKIQELKALGDNVLDIPESCGLLTDQEIEITSKNDAVDIVEKIRDKVYTAEAVTVAFCKRAAIAQQLTNCLTEIMFEEAIDRARMLDKQRSHMDVLPPLFGLPISLKDSFNIPGKDSTIGFMCFVNSPSKEYSALPALLLSLGAILYCKTNVPQTMMTADSDNNVFGRTLNPANRKFTAGGSTGGEGALIALRGSVIGFGTDIAGSIRIPSACNGIYGLKPSADIVPFGGQQDTAPAGMPGILPSAGPMTTSLRSVSFLMRTIMKAEAWRFDSSCVHIPWTGKSLPADHKIRIGVVSDDKLHTPSPPVRRNLKESVEKLRKAGVEVIELELPALNESLETIWQMYSLDGCKFMQALIDSGKEPMVPSVQKVNLVGIPEVSLDGFITLNATRHRIEEAYRTLWREHNLDAIMIPPAPHTTVPHDTWDAITYTALWNLLDYPAAVIPTSKVNTNDLADSIDNATYGEQDVKSYQLYTGPEEYKGLPLTVQLVGMRQEDEALIQVVTAVDGILNA